MLGTSQGGRVGVERPNLGEMATNMKTQITEDEIMSKRTPNGGWTRRQLAEWGVPWPPPKGWKERLLANGLPYSEVIEAFGGGKLIAEDRPLFCKTCDGDLLREYQRSYATAPMKALVLLIEKRRGNITRAVWPNGRCEWQCGRCRRKV